MIRMMMILWGCKFKNIFAHIDDDFNLKDYDGCSFYDGTTTAYKLWRSLRKRVFIMLCI
jgi:hypothetical protein